MDEEDELVSGDEGGGVADDDDGPPPPPEERDDDAVVAEEGDEEDFDDVPEGVEEDDDAMEGTVSQLQQEEEEDDDPELDSAFSVPYNRQFYAAPNSAIARDYDHSLEVPSIERLSEMSQPTPPPEKWPSPDQIEPSMIVVLKGKVAAGDTTERFVWYIRLVVAGDEGIDGDDKNIFRHIPKPVVKKLVAHYNADPSLRTSSLLTKYVPYDDNNKPLNPSKLHDNNWNVRKPPPKTLAQTIGKENKPGGASVASSSSGKRKEVDEAPLAEPVAKKPKQGTVAPPLGKAKAPVPAPPKSLKDLGKGPTKSSLSSSGAPVTAPKPKAPAPAAVAPKQAQAAAPASAHKPKAVPVRGSPSPTAEARQPPAKKQAVEKPPEPAASSAVEARDAAASASGAQIVPMGGASDIGPSPGHKMIKIITVSNNTHNPEEMAYTVTFPQWAKSWKITAEFTGDA